MSQSRVKNLLEVGTNVAVLLAAMTVIAFFAVGYFNPKKVQPKKEIPQPSQTKLQAGQVFPRVGGIDYNEAPRTLIIMMSTKCRFCVASLPFYERMMDEKNYGKESIHIVAAFPNSPDEVKEFVVEKQFSVETVAGLDLAEVGLLFTPTLILVDKSGKILKSWAGQLTPDGEKNVFEALNTPV